MSTLYIPPFISETVRAQLRRLQSRWAGAIYLLFPIYLVWVEYQYLWSPQALFHSDGVVPFRIACQLLAVYAVNLITFYEDTYATSPTFV